jgi:Glycosyltransferase (GlcNAc)
MMRIFVQLASYRDPELVPTIHNMLSEAKDPGRLRFGICRQYHERDRFDDLRHLKRDRRFGIFDVPYRQSLGACWARSLTQRFFAGEEYTLQIDSHMRFAPHWDETLIGMLRLLMSECGVPKPILTTYPPGFDPRRHLDVRRPAPPLRIVFNGFSTDGALTAAPDVLPRWQHLRYPVRARFYAGGFAFTLGRFCTDVPYDPYLYFLGEEITMAVRAFSHGYDLFHPHKTVLWHFYGRANREKHWDDHTDWHIRNDASLDRMRRLLGMSPQSSKTMFGKYGLGKMRTLRQYELYAGISFAKRMALR